jgi:hypothetical protein
MYISSFFFFSFRLMPSNFFYLNDYFLIIIRNSNRLHGSYDKLDGGTLSEALQGSFKVMFNKII